MPGRVDRLKSLMSRVIGWVKDRREVRALQWYLARRGNLLSGGIAYSALFAIGAGLTIGFTIFSRALDERDELMAAVVKQIDLWLPGVVGTGPDDLISPDELSDQLVVDNFWTTTTIIATAVLLWTAISFMGALRHSVRSMFDSPVVGVNPVLAKVWQLLGFVILGAMLVVTAAASILSQTVRSEIVDWFGDSPALVELLAFGPLGVAVLLDAALIYLVIRVVARVRPRRGRDMAIGCLLAGLVSGALRSAGTSLVTSSVSSNVVLGSFVTIGTILLLANVLSRMLLMICAWMYDPPRMDEVARADAELVALRHEQEVDRLVRRGAGSGRPYSPVVRGVRRGTYAF